jgi:hypothetical protein
MAAKKNVLSLVHSSSEIRRPPLVGMQFLHKRASDVPNLVRARPRLHAKDLLSFLISHFSAVPPRVDLPRCRVRLHVVAPSGVPAVKISHR